MTLNSRMNFFGIILKDLKNVVNSGIKHFWFFNFFYPSIKIAFGGLFLFFKVYFNPRLIFQLKSPKMFRRINLVKTMGGAKGVRVRSIKKKWVFSFHWVNWWASTWHWLYIFYALLILLQIIIANTQAKFIARLRF